MCTHLLLPHCCLLLEQGSGKRGPCMFALCSITAVQCALPGVFSPSPPRQAHVVLPTCSSHCWPLLLQEPDYGALYEGRHPGFYVEANPMPTFKVCPTAACCKLQAWLLPSAPSPSPSHPALLGSAGVSEDEGGPSVG